ncbi:MAG: LpxI family protein [Pseudooceanicola sp.]
MSGRLGLLAFTGGLPEAVLGAQPDAHVITFDGVESSVAPSSDTPQRFETMGAVIAELKEAGVDRIVLAGGLARPPLDPSRLDTVTMSFAPRLMAALGQGDDALLRSVIGFFEEHGLQAVGAHEVVPDLTAPQGLLAGPEPDVAALADIERAWAILDTLSPLDVGQACVVAGGQCIGIETLQGTDTLLRQTAEMDTGLRPAKPGVLVKRPKTGQDLRVDMPAIGPATVEGAAAAGLAGIAIAADRVLLIDRDALVAAAEKAGLFIFARKP